MQKVFLFITLLHLGIICGAQNDDFSSFREGIIRDYKDFRRTVLDDYANYLEGVWKDFQVFRGIKKDDTPKPVVIPKADEMPAAPSPQSLPTPKVAPHVNVNPQATPTITPYNPIIPSKPIAAPTLEFTFYGMKINMAKMETYKVTSLDASDVADAWRKYQKVGCKEVIQSLRLNSEALGLNDWFMVELARAYADELHKGGSSNDRLVLQHYLLANMGFDVRLARTNRQFMLLIPFKQTVYEHSFLNIAGEKYYVFYDNVSPINESSSFISTCEIPDGINKGTSVDLVFKTYPLNVKWGEDIQRSLSDGKLNIMCSVNTGAMGMLRHYPQMDVPCYASSSVIPFVHHDIIRQLKPQIANMGKIDAANALLHFVQYAFDYATDDVQHGYEKPYFIEENFYYPKNDCEDRAVFYAFLVRNLLDLDVHLVHYPGHECTAVRFTDSSVNGDGYMYDNQRYVICDPTYIGASIGQCMPEFINEQPKIELWY